MGGRVARACCTLGSPRIVHFFYRTSPGINQRLLSVGMSEDTQKTMSHSRRDAQDKEITFKFAADATAEHPYASMEHGHGAYVCTLPRPGRPSRLVPWPGEVVGVWNLMSQP